MSIKLETVKKKLFEDSKFIKAYEKMKPEFELAAALIEARIKAEMSQEQVAKRMGTTQSAVARLESGEHLPSFKSIQKYAHAVNQIIPIAIRP